MTHYHTSRQVSISPLILTAHEVVRIIHITGSVILCTGKAAILDKLTEIIKTFVYQGCDYAIVKQGTDRLSWKPKRNKNHVSLRNFTDDGTKELWLFYCNCQSSWTHMMRSSHFTCFLSFFLAVIWSHLTVLYWNCLIVPNTVCFPIL